MAARTPKFSYWQDAPHPRSQLVLFSTTLEERIPTDHPVRLLDEILDEVDWTEWEARYSGVLGKPPIHPSVMCKVLLYAMSRRMRSSREIEYAVGHNIDFMWLVSGRSIDHSTLSEFRRKHGDELRGVYKQMVKLAINMGVAKLCELCIDGTKIQANASRHSVYKREGVTKLLEVLDGQIAEALAKLESCDALDEICDDGIPVDKLPTELSDLQQRRVKLQEALLQLEQMEEQRRCDGIDSKKNPAQLPISDRDSRILPNKEGGYAPNYTPMAITETESGFIVGEAVIIGNVEHIHTLPMLDEIEAAYESHTDVLLGDGAYATGPNLAKAQQRGIELLSPVRQEVTKAENPAYREDLTQPVAQEDICRLPINATTKRFDRTAFVYTPETDSYHCPAGKELTREGKAERIIRAGEEAEKISFRCHSCSGCTLAGKCRTNEDSKSGRKVSHDQYREIREQQAERMKDPESQKRYSKRQHFGETQFAFIKANLGIRRFLLRGHQKVQVEWRWACLTYNLKKLLTLIAKQRNLGMQGTAELG